MKQIALVDDLTVIRKRKHLKCWWDLIIQYRPYILIVTYAYCSQAKQLFSNSDGNCQHRVVIVYKEYTMKYVNENVDDFKHVLLNGYDFHNVERLL